MTHVVAVVLLPLDTGETARLKRVEAVIGALAQAWRNIASPFWRSMWSL